MMFIGKYLLPKAELDANQEIEQEIEATVHDSKKQIISGLILAVVIVVMALDIKIYLFGNGCCNRCTGLCTDRLSD